MSEIEVMSKSSSEDMPSQIAEIIKISVGNRDRNTENLSLNIKLNSQNYALWSRMIKVAIGGKSNSLLSHIFGNLDESDSDSEAHEWWEQYDFVVLSWLIQNIEP